MHRNVLTHPRDQRKDPWVAIVGLGFGRGEQARTRAMQQQMACGQAPCPGEVDGGEGVTRGVLQGQTRRRTVRSPNLVPSGALRTKRRKTEAEIGRGRGGGSGSAEPFQPPGAVPGR